MLTWVRPINERAGDCRRAISKRGCTTSAQLAVKVLEPLRQAMTQEVERLKHEIGGLDLQRWARQRRRH